MPRDCNITKVIYELRKFFVTLCLCNAEYFLEDSDLEGLSDITVSSVHTSDLSSFEGESEDEDQKSDSSEEGELPADGLFFLFLVAKTNCDVF